MLTEEKMLLTQTIADLITLGYKTEVSMADRLKVNTTTIRRYKPYAIEMLNRTKLERRELIRNREIRRCYAAIEQITLDLQKAKTANEKSVLYSSLARFNQHLALLAGLTYDTKQLYNKQPNQIVIIRAQKS